MGSNAAGQEERSAEVTTNPRSTKSRIITAISIGNALEWYDWSVFAIFTTYFAGEFFHSADKVSAVLSAMLVFAVGFFMRPIGGLVFGRLADRRGRRHVMVVTMLLVAASSVLIAIAPTYTQIGAFASVWLVVARCLQGLAHGGEMGGAYTYMAEIAPRRRRALWGSAIIVSTVAGTVLATLLGAILTATFDDAALNDWVWRIPFLIGGVLGVFALYLRRGLGETEVFTEQARKSATAGEARKGLGVFRDVWRSRAMIGRVIVFVGTTSVFSYTWSVNAPAYAINFFDVADQEAMWAGVAANLVFMAMLPISAVLADRFGRRFNFMLWGVVFALLSFPLFMLLRDSALMLLLAMVAALVVQSLAAGTQVAWFAELFSTGNRAVGVGFAVSVAAAVFGGTAPYLNSWLTSHDMPEVFIWYTIALALIAAVVAYFTPETKGSDLSGVDRPEA